MNDEVNERRWLTYTEAADYLTVSKRTIMRLADRGDLTRYRIGSTEEIRFDRADLDRCLIPVVQS